MLDLKFIRDNLDIVKQAIQLKGETVDILRFETLDKKRREIIGERDTKRKEQKELSQKVAEQQLKKKVLDTSLIAKSRAISDNIKSLETQLKEIEEELRKILIRIPNIPHSSVPLKESVIVKEWGEKRKFSFPGLTCFDICNSLGLVDFKSASKIAGANFPCYIGIGARLERALINFMLDVHIKQGYIEVFPPFIVNRESMFGTAQLPKMETDMYLIEKDDLFLNPTAEVPLINLHREDVLKEKNLPLKYTAYTTCFRREAGSYGQETKGLKRVHQFNKVELIKFTKPEVSYNELEATLDDAEQVLKALDIPYRVRLLSANDMSFASSKTYDIEAWAPVTQEYLEVSSVSNCEDFQARRAGIRYRKKEGGTSFVHILNASGLATPRTFIAIIENYQNKDGTVSVPPALIPYMGGIEKIG